MLADVYSLDRVERFLVAANQWKPFPTIEDRGEWEGLLAYPLRRMQRDDLIRQAQVFLEEPITQLPATAHLQFSRTGDRNQFQNVYFRRRTRLGVLVLAECFENKGRFLDAILDTAWAITEEATWSLHAHVQAVPIKGAGSLPRQDQHTVDLFAAETALVLAETLYLMRSKFTPELQALSDRIEREIETRIVDELLARETVWWKSGANNWTPWCASNVTGAAMYVVRDPKKLARIVHQMMVYSDRFIAHYSDDGGCDEGPVYWTVSPGALFIQLEFLHSRSNGQISFYQEPKLRRMASFPLDSHIDGALAMNFADSSPRLSLFPGTISRVAQRINEPALAKLVNGWRRNFVPGGPVVNLWNNGNGAALNHGLRDLFWADNDTPDELVPKKVTAWYPIIQVVISRETSTPATGLTFAGKGGHNAENHNHNDVGQFMLFADGQPAVIDVGVESYTRQTFSSDRYAIWCIRGSGHNPPLIGEYEQLAGREYEATEVSLDDQKERTTLRVGMHKAYPPAAGLASLIRTMTLDRVGHTFVVSDEYAFKERWLPMRVRLFCPVQPVIRGAHQVFIPAGARGVSLNVAGAMTLGLFERQISDEWMIKSWGTKIWGIDLTHEPTGLAGRYSMGFEVWG